MNTTGKATWPTHTQKCYLQSSDDGYWEYATDENGTCIDPFYTSPFIAGEYSGNSPAPAALDFYTERSYAIEDSNYGWPDILERDEYPLEIQCSSCFL